MQLAENNHKARTGKLRQICTRQNIDASMRRLQHLCEASIPVAGVRVATAMDEGRDHCGDKATVA